jgi:LPS-assembly lipoprotein
LYQWIKRSCACAASTAALLALAGCGFQPLYGEGSPAAEMVGRVAVAPLDGEGEAGFALRERLTERLGPATAPTHRLEVDLELESEGVALTQDDLTTRFNVTGVAAFALVPLAGGPPAVAGEVRSVTGYSAPASRAASAFATLVAEEDAEERLARALADQIAQRLALSAAEWAA